MGKFRMYRTQQSTHVHSVTWHDDEKLFDLSTKNLAIRTESPLETESGVIAPVDNATSIISALLPVAKT